jgi:hypothetical protein
MYDTVQNDQFPTGAQAYAAYVDGHIANQPNYNYIVSTFPTAHHLSIALFASDNADALDVEPGAASASDIPGWYQRQKSRGVGRPCIYSSVSSMASSVLPTLSQAKIPRGDVRLWSAHYGLGQHICGPSSCKQVSVEMDGTQWNNAALGRNLDESLLLDTFFGTTPGTLVETELQSGQLNNGSHALTAIAVAPGSAHHIAFGCDNGVKGRPIPVIRVAIYSTGPGWNVFADVRVEGNKGLKIIAFPNAAKTGVISVIRADAGDVDMGYVVY